MGGHLFVLRGDLTKLHCSGVLVPCDENWELVWDNWEPLLSPGQFVPSDQYGARLRNNAFNGRFRDLDQIGGRQIRLVVTAREGEDDAEWVADGVTQAIEDFATRLDAGTGRAKPLVALPLVGTGEGGFKNRRGKLIGALVPALRDVASRVNVDVAVVLYDERDYAAIQGQRSATDWSEAEFSQEQLTVADELGAKSARGELSLFLGSGVSTPLGLPSWQQLLEELGGKQLARFDPAEAPRLAQLISDDIGRDHFRNGAAAMLTASGFAPAHLLLASLGSKQTVTTNFDRAFESALNGAIGAANYRVMTQQLAQQPLSWLLKIHGDVDDPNSMVITEDDYEILEADRPALIAIVDSLLLTSHLMFVGYSMADPIIVKAAERVGRIRNLAANKPSRPLATVLALDPAAVSTLDGFSTVTMLRQGGDDVSAARKLEIFLDRIAWAAAQEGTGALAYLLDPDYDDLFEEDAATNRLRDALRQLSWLKRSDPTPDSTRAWGRVDQFLAELGEREHPWRRESEGLQGRQPTDR